jgi:hypothetical protein
LSINFFLPLRTSCEIVGISKVLLTFLPIFPENGSAKVQIKITLPTFSVKNFKCMLLGLIPELRAGKNKEGYESRKTVYRNHRSECDWNL